MDRPNQTVLQQADHLLEETAKILSNPYFRSAFSPSELANMDEMLASLRADRAQIDDDNETSAQTPTQTETSEASDEPEIIAKNKTLSNILETNQEFKKELFTLARKYFPNNYTGPFKSATELLKCVATILVIFTPDIDTFDTKTVMAQALLAQFCEQVRPHYDQIQSHRHEYFSTK